MKIKIKKISGLYPTLIVVVSILVNIGFFIKFYEKDRVLSIDQMRHDSIAVSILSGKSSFILKGTKEDIGNAIMPGYAFFLAIIFFLFGHHYIFVYIIQVIFSIAAALIFFHVMKRHVHSFAALISTFWLIAYYPLWRGSFSFMRESISASILIIGLYYIDLYFEKLQNKYLYIFALIFGILISIYNRLILHFAFFVFYLFFLYIKKGIKLKPVIISSLIVFSILLPWHIRQYIVHDQVVVFSPLRTGEAVKGMSDISYIKKSKSFLSFEEYQNSVLIGGQNKEGKKYFEKHFTKDKFEEMKKNYNAFQGFNKCFSRFMGFWEIYNNKIRFGFGGDVRISVPSSTIIKYTQIIIFAPMILFFIIGFVFSLRKGDKFFTLLGILIFANVLLHSYVHYIHRYRLAMIPLIFMLGWYGIDQVIKFRIKIRVIRVIRGLKKRR